MKTTLLIVLIFLISCSPHRMPEVLENRNVTFDVASFPNNPKAQKQSQPVKFLGCINPSSLKVNWAQDDQKISLPYQFKNDSCPNGVCTASKYYMASPPVYVGKNRGILGQLIPDRFSWDGNDVHVGMTYSVIAPLNFGKIDASFDHKKGDEDCGEVAIVPINIDCPNLLRIDGTKGASGIGFIKNAKGQREIFIPQVGPDKDKTQALCTATILDDIILTHQIYFNNGPALTKTVSMTDLFNTRNARGQSESMQFVCKKRPKDEVPTGCLPSPSTTPY